MCELVRRAMRGRARRRLGADLCASGVRQARRTRALACAAAGAAAATSRTCAAEVDAAARAVDELIGIARRTRRTPRSYHLKAAGAAASRCSKGAIARIARAARAEASTSAPTCHPYLAGASGLDASVPPWAGRRARRLDSAPAGPRAAPRDRRADRPPDPSESLYAAAGSADNVRLLGFPQPSAAGLRQAEPGRGRRAA